MSAEPTRHLRAVNPRSRPSVIVDMRHPSFSSPWTIEEILNGQRAPVPQDVTSAMYVAAWARAEHCPLNILAGRLEPHCRYNPSETLWAAVGQAMWKIVGSLGFAVPIRLDEHKRAFAATWPYEGKN
jgi:hypothetical protein